MMHILAQNQSYDTQARTLTLGHKVPPCFIFFCRRIFASHCRQLHHAAVMIPHKTHSRSNICNLYTPGITPLTHTYHSTLRRAASSPYSVPSLLGPCPALSLSELPPGQPLISSTSISPISTALRLLKPPTQALTNIQCWTLSCSTFFHLFHPTDTADISRPSAGKVLSRIRCSAGGGPLFLLLKKQHAQNIHGTAEP